MVLRPALPTMHPCYRTLQPQPLYDTAATHTAAHAPYPNGGSLVAAMKQALGIGLSKGGGGSGAQRMSHAATAGALSGGTLQHPGPATGAQLAGVGGEMLPPTAQAGASHGVVTDFIATQAQHLELPLQQQQQQQLGLGGGLLGPAADRLGGLSMGEGSTVGAGLLGTLGPALHMPSADPFSATNMPWMQASHTNTAGAAAHQEASPPAGARTPEAAGSRGISTAVPMQQQHLAVVYTAIPLCAGTAPQVACVQRPAAPPVATQAFASACTPGSAVAQPTGAGVVAVFTPAGRLTWTPELHSSFVKSVDQLGGLQRATPADILKAMGVEGLTYSHINSHLQKNRLKLQAAPGAPASSAPSSGTLQPTSAPQASAPTIPAVGAGMGIRAGEGDPSQPQPQQQQRELGTSQYKGVYRCGSIGNKPRYKVQYSHNGSVGVSP
jgi:SHAQKYF class myb-like DNA-binding protein